MSAPAESIREIRRPQPGELWSLWQIMERFRATSFAAVLSAMHRLAMLLDGLNVPEEVWRRDAIEIMADNARGIAEVPLSRTLRLQFDRTLRRIREGADRAECSVLIREFSNNLIVELSAAWFLVIPAERRERYEQEQPPFGPLVAKRFSAANKDISAASRCFALDEGTACVFHLMRVLELGLKALAADVGLPTDAVAREQWKNIIDQIEKKIREMEAGPKTANKTERTQALSAAAVQFRYFKDAWRNHVSHAHAAYDEREASTVFSHVEAFMTQLAGLLTEEQSS